MSLKEKITDDMKAAMRAKESARLGTIRLLTSAIKQKEVDERIELTDEQILAVIEKMIKQRKDSITQFEAGGRQDLADIEKSELVILSAYICLPLCRTLKCKLKSVPQSQLSVPLVRKTWAKSWAC